MFTAIESMGSDRRSRLRAGGWLPRRVPGAGEPPLALRSFLAEGVWGTSPHLIPHFALHSPSGTISLALGLHGPNLGVGGGLHAAAEGFLTALTWLSSGRVPGVWLVFSGWSPELIPDRCGNAPSVSENARPGPGAGGRRHSQAGRRFGRSLGRTPPAGSPADLVRLAERLARNGAPVAPDDRDRPDGRLRIELVDGSDGPGMRHHGHERRNRSGSRVWGPRRRWVACSRTSRRTCWRAGRACRW